MWGTVSPEEVEALCGTLDSLTTAGLEIDDDGLGTVSEKIGLPVRRSARPAPVAGPGGIQPFSATWLKKSR